MLDGFELRPLAEQVALVWGGISLLIMAFAVIGLTIRPRVVELWAMFLMAGASAFTAFAMVSHW